MKILIDCSNLYAGGGVQVASSFINDLMRISTTNKYLVVLSPKMKYFSQEMNSDYIEFITINNKAHRSVLRRRSIMRKLELDYKPDVIFCVFGPSYHKSAFPKVVGFAIPHLIYTRSPYLIGLTVLEKIRNLALMKLKKYFFIKNSDALIFETEDARTIFENRNSNVENTYVVGNTLNEVFNNKDLWKPKDFGFSSDINILYLTANYPHKNIAIIPNVIDQLVEKYKMDNFKFILSINRSEIAIESKYDQYIEYLGSVDLAHLPSLYKQVDILFMPSLLEVFSASYLEGMFMQVPIVASDMSFARDICGDAAIYCDPVDALAYADSIFKVSNDTDLRNKLVDNGSVNIKKFNTSLERTQKYLTILKENSRHYEISE